MKLLMPWQIEGRTVATTNEYLNYLAIYFTDGSTIILCGYDEYEGHAVNLTHVNELYELSHHELFQLGFITEEQAKELDKKQEEERKAREVQQASFRAETIERIERAKLKELKAKYENI